MAIARSNHSIDELESIDGASVINECILVDNAMDPIRGAMPDDDVKDIERWIKIAIENANRMGITNVHDAWQDTNIVKAIQNLIDKNERGLLNVGTLD